MKSQNLQNAKSAKNDEFYTQIADVAEELKHYKHHFKNKTVFCNCDDPERSAFWKYFHLNFAELGLKKLISTYYNKTNPAYKTEYAGGNDNDVNTGTKTALQGNGDFRNQECTELLEKSDIIVTNPPFSLFREYIACLMKYNKKFLIIGSKNAITYKEFFPLLKDNKVWTGYNSVKKFIQPDNKIKKFGNIGWFTNLDIKKKHEKLVLWKNYNPEEFPKYDNYDAINVNKISEIPADYNGVMGVPITFLDSFNPDQFEILGLTSGRCEFDPLAYPVKKYINAVQHNKDGSVSNGSKANTRATLISNSPDGVYYTADNADGKLTIVYVRILIRRK